MERIVVSGAVGDDLTPIIRDTGAIAAALVADPGAAVACYDGWTLVDLARHVGQIHRWVTGVVEARATSRPGGGYPPAPEDDATLAAWLVDGAAGLVAALDAVDPQVESWTISRTWRDLAFWRQRMVLETAMHRWDAAAALGQDVAIDPAVARAGVEETLDVYLAQRLDGADVRGDGRRVAFATPDDDEGWTLVLEPEAVRLHQGTADADATVRGSALDLWLLLTCRRALDGLEVEGDSDLAALAARAATLSPGPAG